MSITDDMNTLFTVLAEAKATNSAKECLKDIRNSVRENNAKIQALVAEGNFTSIPASIKTELLEIWTATKVLETAFEDVGVAEVLDWNPPA